MSTATTILRQQEPPDLGDGVYRPAFCESHGQSLFERGAPRERFRRPTGKQVVERCCAIPRCPRPIAFLERAQPTIRVLAEAAEAAGII